MANQKVGYIWKTGRGSVINTTLRKCDATNLPTIGDICIIVAGEVEFMPSTPGSATAAQRTLAGICCDPGLVDGKLNQPGYAAAASGRPAHANFGGVGSRASALNETNQRMIADVLPEDVFVLTRKTDTAITMYNNYGVDRVAAGNYILDDGDAQDVMKVMGYWSPDILAGMPTSGSTGSGADAARVWCHPVLTQGIS